MKTKIRPTSFAARLAALRKDTPKNRRAALELLNERHFAIRVGNSHTVCDVTTSDHAVLPQKQSEFTKRYSTYAYTVQGKSDPQPLGKLWLEWPGRKEYDGTLIFDPAAPVDSNTEDYNTWRGFRLKPRTGDWSRFQHHLREHVCRGNQEWYDYLLKYFAHMVQFSGRLPGVAIVIRGKQGTGKTVVYKMLELMFHPFNAVLVEDPQRITGHFNWHLADKILVCADEAFFARDRQLPGPLKSRITAERMLFESKGIDAITLNNYVRLFIISNNEHVIHADADERRYFVLETADTFAQQPGESESVAAARRKAYFDPISQQMKHEGGAEAMMFDLRHMDLAGFDPRVFPDTPFLARQKELSRQPHEQWLADKLADDGCWWFADEDKRPTKKQVYEDYRSEASRYNRRSPLLTVEQIGRFLSGVFGLGVGTRKHRMADGTQVRVYAFPPLAEARELWQQYSGTARRVRVRVKLRAVPPAEKNVS
jgi:hypothetical protein